MKERIAYIYVVYVMAVAQIAVDLYLPSFPAMKLALHTNEAMVQLSLTIYAVSYGISQLFYGSLSDRYGRKPFAVFGTGLFFLSSVGMVFTGSISMLLILRLLQGIGGGACSVMSRAVTRDVFEGKAYQKVAAAQALAWSFMPMIGPVLGGYIQHYLGWRYNFAALAIIASSTFLFSVFALVETNKHKLKRLMLKEYLASFGVLFRSKDFLVNTIINSSSMAKILGFAAAAPFIIQVTYHQSAVVYGWITLAIALSYIFGSVLNRFLVGYYDSMNIAVVGTIVTFLGLLTLFVLALFSHLSLLELVVTVFAGFIGIPLSYPNCATLMMLPFPTMAGSAAALYGTILMVSGGLGSAVMAHVHDNTVLPVAILLVSLAAISMVVMLWYRTDAKQKGHCKAL